MEMNWETGYILFIGITVFINYLYLLFTIFKNFKLIPSNFKNIFLSYSLYVIIIILSNFIPRDNTYIILFFNILSIFLEITFLISVFKKILEIPKLLIFLIYFFFAIIFILIFTTLNPKLDDRFGINNYFTLIYFFLSIFTLCFLRIYLKKISIINFQISIFKTPLNIILIGIFFCYGISLPIDTIYSYLILFEKPFFIELILQNLKIFNVVKVTELLSFVILNIALIKSIKCFKPTQFLI
jgi:hypothetical protein